MENIDILQLARKRAKNLKKNVFLTTKYEQNGDPKIVNLEHFLCPKVGGRGAQTHLCSNPLTFENGGGGLVPPCPLPVVSSVVTRYKKLQFLHIYTTL